MQVRPLLDRKGRRVWRQYDPPVPCDTFDDTFAEFLFQLLHTGPLLEQAAIKEYIEERRPKEGPLDRHIIISTLEIDVVTSSSNYIMSTTTKDKIKRSFTHLCWTFVYNVIDSLEYACFSEVHYGVKLYQRIGEIKILYEGKLHRVWNLGKELANF